MKKINIIGNAGGNKSISDGGRIKIRLYLKLLKNRYDVNLIELDGWKNHFFKTIRQIKTAIKKNEDIIIMAGPKGCRYIIPIVTFLNKKRKSRVVYCPVGIGTIDKILEKIKPSDLSKFLLNFEFNGIKDRKIKKCLSTFDFVILENNVLKKCYEKFYSLHNVVVLPNFRVLDTKVDSHSLIMPENLKCIFYSRINYTKGIDDLVYAVKHLNKSNNNKIFLDIYGEIQIPQSDFEKMLDSNIKYRGLVNQDNCYNILSKYDLFVLPTKYVGEGTPGSLVESLISGTPVLISNYSQVGELITEGYNGFIFEIDNRDSLIDKLNYVYQNKKILNDMILNSKKSSEKFIFENISKDFYYFLGGDI